MRPLTLLLLCGGLALGTAVGVCLWPALWPTDAAPRPIGADATAAASRAPEAVAGVAPTVAPSDDPADSLRDAVDAPAPDAARTEVPAAAPVALIDVRVVAGDPPLPAAGAKVRWLTQARWEKLKLAPGTSELELPERYGATATTDADGTVKVPRTDGTTLFAALRGDAFAFARAELQQQKNDVVLQMRTDETLRLLVQDLAGKPVTGVPLAVQASKREQASKQGKYEPPDRIWNGASAPDGTAVVRHFQVIRAGVPAVQRTVAMIAAPLPQPVLAEVPRPPPSEPLLLQMPPAGRIEVTLVDATGTPVLARARADLRLAKKPGGQAIDPQSIDPAARGADVLWEPKQLGAAPIVYAPVGLGLDCQFNCRLEGDREPFGKVLQTPLNPGEVVQVAVPLPPDRGLVAGQALQPDGTPLADSDLAASFAPFGMPAKNLRARSAHTLADGRFDFVVRPPAASGASFELRTTQADGTVIGARGNIGMLAPGRRSELGVVQFAPLPALAAGRTVDDRGEPVAGANVQVEVEAMDGKALGQFAVPLLSVQTGADGSFELFGARPPGNLRLHAEAGGHAPAFAPLLAPGATVTLVMPRLANLAGTLLAPEWLPRGAVSMHLALVVDPQRTRDQQLSGRRIAVRDLMPGVYDLTVRVRNLPEPVLSVPDLQLLPGNNTDARLDPLDLTRAIFRYRLRAVGAAGELLAELNGPILARLLQANGTTANLTFRWQKGRAELITGCAPIDLTLFGRGMPPTQLSVGPGDQDVYIPRLNPVIVNLPGLRAMAGPERAVRVSMIFTGDTGMPQSAAGIDQRTGEQFGFQRWDLGKSSGAWLGASDTVQVPLSRGGPHEVVLRFGESSQQNSRQISISLATIDARVDEAQPVVYTLAPDPMAVAQALTGFGPR
jgi:hypothetical protein